MLEEHKPSSILYFNGEFFKNSFQTSNANSLPEHCMKLYNKVIKEANYTKYSFKGTSWFILHSLWKRNHFQLPLEAEKDLRKS